MKVIFYTFTRKKTNYAELNFSSSPDIIVTEGEMDRRCSDSTYSCK